MPPRTTKVLNRRQSSTRRGATLAAQQDRDIYAKPARHWERKLVVVGSMRLPKWVQSDVPVYSQVASAAAADHKSFNPNQMLGTPNVTGGAATPDHLMHGASTGAGAGGANGYSNPAAAAAAASAASNPYAAYVAATSGAAANLNSFPQPTLNTSQQYYMPQPLPAASPLAYGQHSFGQATPTAASGTAAASGAAFASHFGLPLHAQPPPPQPLFGAIPPPAASHAHGAGSSFGYPPLSGGTDSSVPGPFL